MRVTVYGLWHLGCVTAACLAEAGHHVIGLDPQGDGVAALTQGQPPLHEPGLAELLSAGRAGGRLSFTTDAAMALHDTDILWVTFDTPVDDRDEADAGFVRRQLEAIADHVRPGTLILISSQVPVGFTRALERDWSERGLRFACSPENLRLGKALEAFRRQERVIVGVRDPADRPQLADLFAPFCAHIEWMSVESAEMTKHALNAFLATSVTFINEIARLCEIQGADAREVERGLKSEARIGPRAYLKPGAAFAGGTLARDLRFLVQLGEQSRLPTPLFRGVLASNERHKGWLHERVTELLEGITRPVVAVLGLTYKPGTNTLRRSASVELCRWLLGRGVAVRAHDPVVRTLPDELRSVVALAPEAGDALAGADLAVLATEWPDYRALRATHFIERMRRPRVIDPNWFLAEALGHDPRIVYVATGKSPV